MTTLQTPPTRRLSEKLSRPFSNITSAAVASGVGALIIAGILRLITPRLEASYLTLLAIGLILILVAAGTGYTAIRSSLSSRKGFYGLNTTIMVALFLAIAGLVVYIASKNSVRFDTTAAQEFSLAKQTSQILRNLDHNVEAFAFFTPNDPLQATVRAQAQDVMEEYAATNPSRFRYRVIDPDIEPEEARRLGINPDTQPATIVFSSQGNLQPVNTLLFTSKGGYVQNPNIERDFSQAILAVTREKQKVVYFLQGHGERDAANATDGNGFAFAKRGLEADNYLVKALNSVDLASLGAMPEDANVLVIAGPKADLLEEEIKPIDDFLTNAGKAIFLLEPETPPSFVQLIKNWGVTLGKGSVIDPANSVASNPRAPLVRRQTYSDPVKIGLFSPITKALDNSTFFDGVAAVVPLDNQGSHEDPPRPNVYYISNNLLVTPLVLSSQFSWLGTNPESSDYNSGDIEGPLAMGVSIDAKAPYGQAPPSNDPDPRRTQLVIIGDVNFATNRFYSSFANGDLFVNAVDWLAGDVELISVRPKIRQTRLLVVTQGDFQIIRWSSWLVLPLVVAVGGAFVWWRRR